MNNNNQDNSSNQKPNENNPNITTSIISLETFQYDSNNNSIMTYQDYKELSKTQSNLKSNINFQYMDLTINPTVSLIISSPKGFLIIFYSNVVKYYKISNNKLIETDSTITYADRKFVSYCLIDEEQNKYFLSDEYGNLFIFVVKDTSYEILMQFLGEISYASCITYLDANYLFIGSTKGNSQLAKVLLSPKENDNKRPFIDIIEEYESLSPISDFTVINNSKEENSVEILTVSGVDKNCSLKNIRKGTSLFFDCEIPIKGILSVHKITYFQNNILIDNNNSSKKLKTCLICSQLKKSFAMDIVGTYTISINPFITFSQNERALYACNILNNDVLIITNKSISIYNECLELKTRQNFEKEIPLTIKYHKKTQCVYYYTNERNLCCFDLTNLKTKIILKDVDISAFDITSLFLIYGLWTESNIYLYSINTGEINILGNIKENVNDILISSIQVIKNEGDKFVFVSLSNGKMLFYKLKQQVRMIQTHSYTADDFIYKRKYNISSENFELFKIEGNYNPNLSFLFLSTTNPSFIYFNKQNPIIANFNVHCFKNLVKLNSNGIYCFIFNDHLSFGTFSNTQSQNILTKKYKNQITNIKQITLNTKTNIPFMIMTIEQDKHLHFILSDINMNEISRYTFNYKNETCRAIDVINSNHNLLYNDSKLIVIGTSIIDNISYEPEYGHLYLMEINTNTYKIQKLNEIETKGGVYTIAISKQNVIFVSIGPFLYIYQLIESSKLKLIKRYNEFSIINNISFLDNYICIADIYKSVALFTYDIEQEKLIEITRDYNPSWILSTVQYDINTMYLSDIDGNVISIQNESLSDESGNKFERKGIFNLGERISKFSITKLQGKSLKDIAVMDTDTEEVSVVYYGTIEGSLGVIIQIKREVFEILEMIQNKLERNECVKKKGFVEGNVLEKFLNFDEEYRKEFLKEINYQCKHNISEIVNIIETLLKYH
jgi:DNA damage-binding protein 1